MAQGNPRPRPGRNQSRLPRTISSGSTSGDESRRDTRRRKGDTDDTIRYIKRILCASSSRKDLPPVDSKPLEELLPPLTSSNEVDVQLYALIAVILSSFVQTWYNRITPDQDFVAEVVQIIAHCTRGLEQRLRHVDLENLLLDELPALMISHIDAVMIAQNTRQHSERDHDVPLIYHSIHPNEALTPPLNSPSNVAEQEENEIAWSQLLVSRVLPLVLPPEDLHNPCLYVLVSEIFSEMIVHRVLCQRVSEPWLLWEGVTKAICVLRPDLGRRPSPPSETPSMSNRREQFGILSSEGAAASGHPPRSKPGRFHSLTGAFWVALQFLSVVWLLLRSFVVALLHASSIPPRSGHPRGRKTSDKPPVSAAVPPGKGSDPQPQVTRDQEALKRPVVRMRVWTCISRLAALDHHMPWLSGLLSLVQWLSLYGPGKVCRTDGALDRLLSSQIQTKLLRSDYLPPLLRAIRSAIFPDNALAAARVPPTPDQVDEIKRTCAETIVDAVPEPVRRRFFATTDVAAMRRDVEGTLELFEDGYINKHLIIRAVELVVVRLFPELSSDEAGAAG